MVVLRLSYTYIGIPYTSACARALSKTRVPRPQTRESARQLLDNIGDRHRHASRGSCGRLLLREQHRSHLRDTRQRPLQQRAWRAAEHRRLRDGGGTRSPTRGRCVAKGS